MENENVNGTPQRVFETKFCKHCGEKIPKDAVLCTHCGRQVEELSGGVTGSPQIVINNDNNNINSNVNTNTNQNPNASVGKTPKNKWVALLLCFFFGWFGGHKFYEGKIGMGILYLLTVGLCGIGVIVDFIVILTKPNPYIP